MSILLSKDSVDGSHAWLVMGAALLHNMVASGTFTSLSVYMLDWKEQYNASTTTLATIGSIKVATACIAGNLSISKGKLMHFLENL